MVTMTKSYKPTRVGVHVQREREGRGWSKAELARRTGLEASTISRVESGQIVAPSTDILRQLAEVFNVPVDRLVHGITPPSAGDTAEFRQYINAKVGADHADLVEAIIDAASEKPSRDRDVILRVARDLIVTFPPLSPRNDSK